MERLVVGGPLPLLYRSTPRSVRDGIELSLSRNYRERFLELFENHA